LQNYNKIKSFKEEAQQQYVEIVSSLLKQEGQGSQKNSASNAGDEEEANSVRVAKQGKVFKIELNRPGKFNAITWQMYQGLSCFVLDFTRQTLVPE
jgi:hypothetical protein